MHIQTILHCFLLNYKTLFIFRKIYKIFVAFCLQIVKYPE